MANYKIATVNDIIMKGGSQAGETGIDLIKAVTYGTLTSSDWATAHNCTYQNTTGLSYSANRVVAIDDIKINVTPSIITLDWYLDKDSLIKNLAKPYYILRASSLKDENNNVIISGAYTTANSSTFSIKLEGNSTKWYLELDGSHNEIRTYTRYLNNDWTSWELDLSATYYYQWVGKSWDYNGKNDYIPVDISRATSLDFQGNNWEDSKYNKYNLNICYPTLDFYCSGGTNHCSNLSNKKLAFLVAPDYPSLYAYWKNDFSGISEGTYNMGWDKYNGINNIHTVNNGLTLNIPNLVITEYEEVSGIRYPTVVEEIPVLSPSIVSGYMTKYGFGLVFGQGNGTHYEKAAVIIFKDGDVTYVDVEPERKQLFVILKNFIL